MEQLVQAITGWILEAGEQIKQAIQYEDIHVDTKANRKDLVTEIDKRTQDFLIEQIQAFDSQAKILAEENGYERLAGFSGRVFVIDPIDGTMNFVLERENFCVMIGVYQDGVGQLGFIYDVMKGQLLWGGPALGVYLNDTPINEPLDLALRDSLVGINAEMYLENVGNAQEIGDRALGVRMTGCAGVELMALILGRRNGYLSNLSPWDYAAGGVLLETIGFKMSQLAGNALKFDGRELFLAGTPSAYAEMLALVQEQTAM